jgi:hypothetical protein
MPKPLKIPDLGRVMQLAYVAEDLDSALKSWTDFGVGPFYKIDRAPFSAVKYRGRSIDLDLTSTFAYWNDMQIEIIRQNDRSDSIFRQWQDERRQGLHHVCITVDDIDEARARATAHGAEIVQENWAGEAGEFFYAEPSGGPGCLIEFARIGAAFVAVFDKIRAASGSWDGTRPVRQLEELF